MLVPITYIITIIYFIYIIIICIHVKTKNTTRGNKILNWFQNIKTVNVKVKN